MRTSLLPQSVIVIPLIPRQIRSYKSQQRCALVYSPPRASKRAPRSLPLVSTKAEAEEKAKALANVGGQPALPWATVEYMHLSLS
jgi:hypothetical protein